MNFFVSPGLTLSENFLAFQRTRQAVSVRVGCNIPTNLPYRLLPSRQQKKRVVMQRGPSARRLAILLSFLVVCASVSPVTVFLWATKLKDPNNVICVYPVSGQYGLLQRLNYYFLLLAAVLAHSKEWLVGGAFAAVMTYAGVVAVHALVLACISATHHDVLDLDVSGAWSVLSVATVMLVPMLEWSYASWDLSAQPLVCFGGFWSP